MNPFLFNPLVWFVGTAIGVSRAVRSPILTLHVTTMRLKR